MRNPIACITLVVAALTAGPALAQTGVVVERSPGVASAKQTLTLTGTVTAIDPSTRAVTLKGPARGSFLLLGAQQEALASGALPDSGERAGKIVCRLP